MDFNLMQITKINQEPFKFLNTNHIGFPVAPLVSANRFVNHGVPTLQVCATLYINAIDSQNPVVGKMSEYGNTFEIYFDYDWDNDTPETYDVWYVEIEYTSDTVENVTEVISYLKNLNSTVPVGSNDEDPTLSRGTKTSSGVESNNSVL